MKNLAIIFGIMMVMVAGLVPARAADDLDALIPAILEVTDPGMTVRGPSRLHRLRGRTRRAILLQAPLSSTLTAATRRVSETGVSLMSSRPSPQAPGATSRPSSVASSRVRSPCSFHPRDAS